jgi:hypothetical protein
MATGRDSKNAVTAHVGRPRPIEGCSGLADAQPQAARARLMYVSGVGP